MSTISFRARLVRLALVQDVLQVHVHDVLGQALDRTGGS